MIQASNKKALELCHFDQSKHVFLEGSEAGLSFGESAAFAAEIHFYCEPNSEPIEPPGHQQGPAQWHGHQVLLSKFNGCVSGEYRIGLDAQRHVIFQREVAPWIVTTTDVIPLREWHSIVCTYDGQFMRIYIDCRHAAHIACGPQKTDLTSPALLGADLCGYATAHHFEGYISECSLWQRSLDASEVKALATSNPLSHKTLSKDLIGYWCVYQREGLRAPIKNAVRLVGEEQFHGQYLVEGAPLLDRWRSWLAAGGEALPPIQPPLADPAEMCAVSGAGPPFSPEAGLHTFICGSASVLSFGNCAPFTLAVLCRPSAQQGIPAEAGGAGANGGECGCGIVLSKFHFGLRGEYRLGFDAQRRPFFHRETEPWDMVSTSAVTADEWHELCATYDGAVMRLYVDRRLVAQARSGAQFTDQVTPVLIGAEYGKNCVQNHFRGYIGEVRVLDRALSSDDLPSLFAPPSKSAGLQRGLLGRWRPMEAKLDDADGRSVIFNSVAPRSATQPFMDAMLKRTRLTFPLEITLRAGVRALLVELGTVTPHTLQWRRAVDMVNQSGGYKHYCYLGTSVALQKSLLQALDLHAHELVVKGCARVHDRADLARGPLYGDGLDEPWRRVVLARGAVVGASQAARGDGAEAARRAGARVGAIPRVVLPQPDLFLARVRRRPMRVLALPISGPARAGDERAGGAGADAFPALQGVAAHHFVVWIRAAVPRVLPHLQASPSGLHTLPDPARRHGLRALEAKVPRPRRLLPHLLPARLGAERGDGATLARLLRAWHHQGDARLRGGVVSQQCNLFRHVQRCAPPVRAVVQHKPGRRDPSPAL